MRTHYGKDITAALIGQEVTLSGWVHRRRDHGGIIFVDLRDLGGLVQVVFDPELTPDFPQAETLRNEFVIQATGSIRPRPEGTINPDMASGEVEYDKTKYQAQARDVKT